MKKTDILLPPKRPQDLWLGVDSIFDKEGNWVHFPLWENLSISEDELLEELIIILLSENIELISIVVRSPDDECTRIVEYAKNFTP